jgi:WD40 repeat protein
LRGEETTLSFNVPYGIRYLLTQNTLITVDNTDSQTMASFREGSLVKRVGFANWVNGPTASPDGNLLAAWGPGPVGITLWKLPSLERVRTISVPVTRLRLDGSLVFSPMGDRLAVLLSHSRVRIFSTVEGQSRDIVIDDPYAEWHNVIVTSAGRLRSMDLSLGLKQFLCSGLSSDGSVCVVHVGPVGSGDPNIVSIFQSKFPYYLQYTLSDTSSGEFRIAVSPSGKYVAETSRSRTYLWVNGIQSEGKYSPLSLQIAFSPDEKYVASASSILNLETGQVTATELVGEEDTYGVLNEPVFSPDGQILAAEMYGTISLWQVSNGALLTKLNDPYGSDRKLIFSPDGAFLIGLGESSISVWGIPQGTHQTD